MQVFRAILLISGLLLSAYLLPAQSSGDFATFASGKSPGGYGVKKLKHPEIFQGNRKKKGYFEGWYFKMVSADHLSVISVIPGISLSADGKEQHAFIQVIDGTTAKTEYFSFPIGQFSYSTDRFAVKIGDNYFSNDSLYLDIKNDSASIKGSVRMFEQVVLPGKKFLNAGIMGWYRFVPFMECYHGVVSLDHRLKGKLVFNGREQEFNEGIGYIEKDWGSSMPSAWIWMQSNHFSSKNTSFMLSVANIPWIGRSFTGFLGFFVHEGQIHRFATYTKANVTIENLTDHVAELTIEDKNFTYRIVANNKDAGLLAAPVQGSMDRRISESINATIRLQVRDKKGRTIFDEISEVAGLELVGEKKVLMR
ncbi:MAG TPA: tocopherol cyclase family protein [Saprospiraceae bacterium]|nr:tocopherol cyclase family protein [Saprospiraceae bacterium]